MRRRRFLATAGAIAVAGCLGEQVGSGPSEATDPSPATSPGGTASPASTGVTPDPSAATAVGSEKSYRVAVTGVTRYDLSLRLNDAGEKPEPGVTELGSLAERERKVVRAAIDGRYETETVPSWLLDFLKKTDYVEANGTVYRLEAEVPEYVLQAKPVEASDVDGQIAEYSTYEEAVTYDGLVHSGLLRRALKQPVRFTAIEPKLKRFLERYEAVRYRGRVLAIEFTRNDPGAPYTVTATSVPLEEVYDGGILVVSDLPDRMREPLRRAAAVEGVHGVKDVSDRLLKRVQSNKYVRIDGHYYYAYATDVSGIPLRPRASVREAHAAPDDPARLRLAVANTGSTALRISNGPPLPYGVVYAHPDGNRDRSALLWTDAYRESEDVFTEGRSVTGANAIAVEERLPAGETTGLTYELDFERFAPETYVIETAIGADPIEGGDGGDVPVEIRFDVAEPER